MEAQPTQHRISFWQACFMAIGIVATTVVILSLFVNRRFSKQDTFSVSEPLTTEDPKLLTTLASLTGTTVTSGGTVTILNNGDAFYPSLLNDMNDAKSSIDFTGYIWEPGTISDQLFDMLIKKANEGVRVRLILDGFGGKSAPKESIQKLEAAGGIVTRFHPLRLGTIIRIYKRDHARAIIIDDRIGYTGGMSVADYWTGSAEDKDHWRDSMFRITGAPVLELKKTFTMLWEITTGEVLVPSLSTDNKKTDLTSVAYTNLAPDQDLEELSTFLITSIAAAQTSISIETPYLVLEPRLQDALFAAADRGVAITLLLPGKYIDTKVVRFSNHYYYAPLLAHGIHVYEYQPTMLHTKFMVIDGHWSIIGSANIDTRSTYFNIENLMGIASPTFGAQLTDVFNADITNAKEITPTAWHNRSIAERVLEFGASLIDKQF